MPQILIKGNHCTLVMRKWSFQHISMPCVNLELKVCFHLTVSVGLIWNDHMFFHQYILSWCYRSSYQMNRYLTFVFSRCLCMLCFICIMLNANKCMPSPLSKWRGDPSPKASKDRLHVTVVPHTNDQMARFGFCFVFSKIWSLKYKPSLKVLIKSFCS